MSKDELVARIHDILGTMRVPLEHVDLDDPKHVGKLVRGLAELNKGHPDLDEVRGLLKRHRYENLMPAAC